MMDTNLDDKGGALPDGTGSRASTEPLSGVSAVPASIPSADHRDIDLALWEAIMELGWSATRQDVAFIRNAIIKAITPPPSASEMIEAALRRLDDTPATVSGSRVVRDLSMPSYRYQGQEFFAASGIAARSDETPQEVRPAGQEPGPQGDAQPQGGSSKRTDNAE